MVKEAAKNGIGTALLKVMAFFFTFVLALFLVLYFLCAMACSPKRPYAQRTFVTTILETGALKFLAGWYLDENEINAIVASNSMEKLEGEVDESLINIREHNPETVYTEHVNEESAGGVSAGEAGSKTKDERIEDPDGDGIDVFEVSGRSFYGKMMIVYDPTRLAVQAKYPWGKVGQTLDRFVADAGAVAGINGGLYEESGNTGGKPYGVVVSNGEILQNKPRQERGLVLVGITEEGILVVEDIAGQTVTYVEELVERKKIKNAVCFQEESSDKNNHFVQLIINGEKREMNGMGSGLNPRTAIGQRADGALLLLVTDGRGASGHLGASASDLIKIMSEYGAVNAANLDGGSSSCMYYNGEYLMNSVTFYYANSSWNMPLALVVK